MSLADQVAKSIYVRRYQFDPAGAGENPDSFHIYEPGSSWGDEHNSWFNLDQNARDNYLNQAELWLSQLSEKSPLTFDYLLANFKDATVTKENLESL
jgi:hypothetical protein